MVRLICLLCGEMLMGKYTIVNKKDYSNSSVNNKPKCQLSC